MLLVIISRYTSQRVWLSCIGPLVLLLPKHEIIWLSNLSIMSVPDEGFSRNMRTKFDNYVFYLNKGNNKITEQLCIMPIYRLNWIMIPIKWTSPLRVLKFRHLTIQPMMESDANTVVWLTCPTRQEQDRGWQESISRSDGPQQDVHSNRIKIQGIYWRKLIWYFFLKFLNSQFLQLF
jgi:hypothetical protein